MITGKISLEEAINIIESYLPSKIRKYKLEYPYNNKPTIYLL